MKTLSIVIPVYNEEQRIEATLKALEKGLGCRGLILEKVLFVDDGSRDRTTAVIAKHAPRIRRATGAQIEIISYAPNRGKGYAVKRGMMASDSDYTLLMDADLSTPLTEIKKFAPFMEKQADVVIGTRKNGESSVVVHQPKLRELLGKAFTLMSNIILNTWVTDFTCGFKLFSREAKNVLFRQSKVNRWGYDAEILYLARKHTFTITEKAVMWSDKKGTKVNLLKDLPQTFLDLMRIRLMHFRATPLFVRHLLYQLEF